MNNNEGHQEDTALNNELAELYTAEGKKIEEESNRAPLERLTEHENVEKAFGGESYNDLITRMREAGWEKERQVTLGLDTAPERSLENKLDKPGYKIVLWTNEALIFVPKE